MCRTISDDSMLGERSVVLDQKDYTRRSTSSEPSVAVSSIRSVVCHRLLLDRSVGMREAGSGEPLGLLRTADSGGDVGVTTKGLLGGVRYLRLFCLWFWPRWLVIHRE